MSQLLLATVFSLLRQDFIYFHKVCLSTSNYIKKSIYYIWLISIYKPFKSNDRIFLAEIYHFSLPINRKLYSENISVIFSSYECKKKIPHYYFDLHPCFLSVLELGLVFTNFLNVYFLKSAQHSTVVAY